MITATLAAGFHRLGPPPGGAPSLNPGYSLDKGAKLG